MNWKQFLEILSRSREYGLTPLEAEVLLCLDETKHQTKKDLFDAYSQCFSEIEEEAFTQRLKNIYKKFRITGNGYKLPQLHACITEKYLQSQNKNVFFAEVGLTDIYPGFPRSVFGQAIHQVIESDQLDHKQIDILQTFAPNLNDYTEHMIYALKRGVRMRILLAWPYSEAAKLREEVLRIYANHQIGDEINIRDCVIENLETLEKIIHISAASHLLQIKLYDTLPSLAIYRAGDYLLAAPFLHGALAIQTFQLELNVNTSNPLIVQTLLNDFDLMWKMARRFYPDPMRNWRNDLKILFTHDPL